MAEEVVAAVAAEVVAVAVVTAATHTEPVIPHSLERDDSHIIEMVDPIMFMQIMT